MGSQTVVELLLEVLVGEKLFLKNDIAIASSSLWGFQHCFFLSVQLAMRRKHLFVRRHDPFNGIGSRGQQVACGGEGFCPLADHAMSGTIFWV